MKKKLLKILLFFIALTLSFGLNIHAALAKGTTTIQPTVISETYISFVPACILDFEVYNK